LAIADLDGVVQPGARARILDAVRIALLVTEFQRIGRDLGKGDIEPGLVVEYRLQPRHRTHAHVVVRPGNHELVSLDILVEYKLSGIGALDPQILRRLTPQHIADLRPDYVSEPIHVLLRIVTAQAALARSVANVFFGGFASEGGDMLPSESAHQAVAPLYGVCEKVRQAIHSKTHRPQSGLLPSLLLS